MPGTTIGIQMTNGFTGRASNSKPPMIKPMIVKSILDGNGAETLSSIPFGYPVVNNTDTTCSKFGQSGSGVSAATAANFGGFAIAEVKQVTTSYYNQNSAGGYAPTEIADIIKEGHIIQKVTDLTNASPVFGGKVYIITVAGGSLVVGDIVASASPTAGTAAELTNCKFTKAVDTNGNAEIHITYQINA